MMPVHEVVTVLYAMRFHGLDAILDQLAHFASISCVQFFSPGNWYLFCDTRSLACVASVSVWFWSKERPRNGILGFGRARNETRAKK